MKRTVWMNVSMDKYRLPIAVADTADELGKKIGKSKATIISEEAKARRKGRECRYIKVIYDEDDEL